MRIHNTIFFLIQINQQQPMLDYVESTENELDVSQMQDSQYSTYIINTNDGQQIILDQQSLMALAASGGDTPQFMMPDGQQIMLSHELLAALTVNNGASGLLTAQQTIDSETGQIEDQINNPDQQILRNADGFAQDTQYLADIDEQDLSVYQQVSAQTNATDAVLTQPPIMSTLEHPSNIDSLPSRLDMDHQNLEESLAVIGVTSNSNVPSSLELPITITNPAIASKSTSMSMTSIYASAGSMASGYVMATPHISTTMSHNVEPELGYDLFNAAPLAQQNLINQQNYIINNGAASPPGTLNMSPQEVLNDNITSDNAGYTSDNSEPCNDIPLQSRVVLRGNQYNEQYYDDQNVGEVTEESEERQFEDISRYNRR